MRSKTKNFIIPLVVYPFDIMVSLGETDEQLFHKFKKTNVEENEYDNAKYGSNNCRGRYCLFRCGASLIRLRKPPVTPEDYGYLQHEIFHAASTILWKVGVNLEPRVSDEAYAYLIQYLTEQIYSKI